MEIRFSMFFGYFVAPSDNWKRDVRPSHICAEVCSLSEIHPQLRLEMNPAAVVSTCPRHPDYDPTCSRSPREARYVEKPTTQTHHSP
jgi:hypothetical protein